MINVRAPEELFPSHHRFHSETNIFLISTTSEQTSSLVKPSQDKSGQRNFVRSLKKKLEVLEHNCVFSVHTLSRDSSALSSLFPCDFCPVREEVTKEVNQRGILRL